MAGTKEFLQKFDHPLLFLFFLILAMKGFESVFTWAAKKAGQQGLASMMQHP